MNTPKRALSNQAVISSSPVSTASPYDHRHSSAAERTKTNADPPATRWRIPAPAFARRASRTFVERTLYSRHPRGEPARPRRRIAVHFYRRVRRAQHVEMGSIVTNSDARHTTVPGGGVLAHITEHRHVAREQRTHDAVVPLLEPQRHLPARVRLETAPDAPAPIVGEHRSARPHGAEIF